MAWGGGAAGCSSHGTHPGNSVNLSGEVAGQSDTKTGAAAFLWDGKKMIDLGSPRFPPGHRAARTGSTTPARWSAGGGSIPCTPGCTATAPSPTCPSPASPRSPGARVARADAIDNSGQILGSCADASNNRHSVLWQNGTVTDLSTLGGLQGFSASVINNLGQIAGSAPTSTGAVDGFLYSNGTMTDLGSFTPAALNDNDVMVGGEDVYSSGTAQNLNNLIPAPVAGHWVTSVTAINDNGQIVGNGQASVLLLTPG